MVFFHFKGDSVSQMCALNAFYFILKDMLKVEIDFSVIYKKCGICLVEREYIFQH